MKKCPLESSLSCHPFVLWTLCMPKGERIVPRVLKVQCIQNMHKTRAEPCRVSVHSIIVNKHPESTLQERTCVTLAPECQMHLVVDIFYHGNCIVCEECNPLSTIGRSCPPYFSAYADSGLRPIKHTIGICASPLLRQIHSLL